MTSLSRPAHGSDSTRLVTYPADALGRVITRLRDLLPHLDHIDCQDIGFDLVIDVVNATDKLRAIEAEETGR